MYNSIFKSPSYPRRHSNLLIKKMLALNSFTTILLNMPYIPILRQMSLIFGVTLITVRMVQNEIARVAKLHPFGPLITSGIIMQPILTLTVKPVSLAFLIMSLRLLHFQYYSMLSLFFLLRHSSSCS